MKRWAIAKGLALLLLAGAASAAEPRILCEAGRALPIELAPGATLAEEQAARELALWLSRSCRAPVRRAGQSDRVVIRVGGRGFGESWSYRVGADGVQISGGRPRGALYAVFALLEEIGVRWWTPWASSLPEARTIALPLGERRGRPHFDYREITDVGGPLPFRARMRLNGHFSRLTPRYGDALRYGPPHHAHTFFTYIPPDRWFESHPQFFSEYAELRFSEETQLCLSEPAVEGLLESQLLQNIELGRQRALRQRREPPRYYGISQNDWGRPCGCDRCHALSEHHGSESGPILRMVNRLARSVAESYPDVQVDTLAYQYSLEPPKELRAEPNVVVRVSGLHQRDFGKPIDDPENAAVLAAIEGWTEVADHVWIWDYATLWGDFDDSPVPNLTWIGDDLKRYAELGIEGIYIQHPYLVGADLRDLKLWVTAKLLEDPARDAQALINEFTEGYYGPGGRFVRRYVERLRERAGERVEFDASLSDLGYLKDPRFMRRAHRLFDRAMKAVAGERHFERRLRHARLTLDRATLHNWGALASSGLQREMIATRYRRSWEEQIELRVAISERAEWLSWVDWELAQLKGERDGG